MILHFLSYEKSQTSFHKRAGLAFCFFKEAIVILGHLFFSSSMNRSASFGEILMLPKEAEL